MCKSSFKHNQLIMKKIAIALFVIATALSFILLDAQSTSSKQLKKDKQKLEREIKNTQELLNQTRKNKNASLEQIAVLRKQISNREDMVVALTDEITRLEDEMSLNEKLSKSLDRKLAYMKDDYARVVYNAYKNRKLTNKITFIFSADNFSHMYQRAKYYRAFAKNVKSQVETIEATQKEIEKKKIEIQEIKEAKSAIMSKEEANLANLEKAKREKDKLAASLKTKEKELSAQIKQKQQQQKKLDAAIQAAIQKEIAADNAKKAKSNKGKNTSTGKSGGNTSKPVITMTPEEQKLSNTFAGNQGRLPWPVTKCSKLRGFGTYPHPDVPSVQIQNNGIDLLTEAGAPVRAVYQGEVVSVMDISGTKVVIIKHGEYMTVYQNLATITVKKGQNVTSKQNIGTVAKNNDTGTYILHFALLKMQTYLNPSSWLAK